MKYYLIVLLTFFISCEKDHSCDSCNGEDYVDAVILNTGPIEVDGCSWVVKIGTEKYYHPDELKEEFKQDNLNVQICYTLKSDKFICGIAGQQMTIIHIKDIRK